MTSFPSDAASTSSATGAKFGRDVLDSTPPHGRLRNAPKSQSHPHSKSPLKLLAGGDSDPDLNSEATENSPEGEGPERDAADETHDLDTHPVVQAFDHYGQAKGHLQIVGTLMGGEVLAPIQDLITNLDQLIPQRGAAMLSGNAIGATSGAPGAGASPLAALAGPPSAGPMGGVGGGAGAGGPIMGLPMGLPSGMTPPAMMGAGGPAM
jgi:hypothetical protein